MTRQVFDNSMVAHVWAQGTQESGRSNNGNVYFRGPFLYSYGSHFVTGYLLPDGAAFLNSDSYSVSTGRHKGDAWSAVRGRHYHVPGLTELACYLNWAVRADTREEARGNLKHMARHFVAQSELASAPAMVAAFRAAKATPREAAAMAARVARDHAARVAKERDKRAKDRRDGLAALAKSYAARPVTVTVAEAMHTTESSYFRAERAEAEWSGRGKELFRAIKEAKARGWTGIARDARRHYDAIRDCIAQFPAIELRRNRLNWFKGQVSKIRAGMAAISESLEKAQHEWRQFAGACDDIAERIRIDAQTGRPGFLRARVAMAGADPLAMCEGLESWAARFRDMAAAQAVADRRADRRAQVSLLRTFRAMEGDCPTCYGVGELAPMSRCSDCGGRGTGGPVTSEERAKVARDVASMAWRYAPRSYGDGKPLYPVPFAFRAAGFTADTFKAIEERASAMATAEERAAAAEELEAWRDGSGPLPRRHGPGYRGAWITDDGRGGAMLRAVNVERDESGTITGGTLETSQGADVPLTHALRAFRFLRHVRGTGKGWRANGRTIRVGHFRVDSIDAEGNFRAGCHRINWQEVSALATRLDVWESERAADTSEDSGRAHVA